MGRRWVLVGALAATLGGSILVAPSAFASANSPVRSTVATTLSPTMPIIRLHFNRAVAVSQLPRLAVTPALDTTWQAIGTYDVQAVVSGPLVPVGQYVIDAPTSMTCSASCSFAAAQPVTVNFSTNVNWEQQLLATLHYLPLTFEPSTPPLSAAAPSEGTYRWSEPNWPASLSGLWAQGNSTVLVTGALMAFQTNHSLPSTGYADALTWSALVNAAQQHQVDPNPYSYVSVSTTRPESLTLYVGGHATFHTVVNTGISVSPTVTGTHPVYLRYTSQTMSGTNPNGTHYRDPGIPWVSYFYGGDALHGFIRSSYGFPQSLGCVEMPFASAKSVWPYTPIGTLVTVS